MSKKYNTIAVCGLSWGDEGKGKITDYVAQKADIVVRFNGGNNAGHTIEADGIKYKFKLIPSNKLSFAATKTHPRTSVIAIVQILTGAIIPNIPKNNAIIPDNIINTPITVVIKSLKRFFIF